MSSNGLVECHNGHNFALRLTILKTIEETNFELDVAVDWAAR